MDAFFFTSPSQLGRRLSTVDPLGFRGVATHFLHRLAPGFTGRVRNRIWFPILCWGAMMLEEEEAQHRGVGEDDPRAQVRARRTALTNLERSLRMAAMLHGKLPDEATWRYGNRDAWYRRHREKSLGSTYRKPEHPPFFSSRGAELANNALGCLRRSLERHAFMLPSESRLGGEFVEVLPMERYRLTDRGRMLAHAFERDLRARGVATTPLKTWGLFPEQLGKKFKNTGEREKALGKILGALPVRGDGSFDDDGFSETWKNLDALFQVEVDPLLEGHASSGPIPAVVRANQAAPESRAHDALGVVVQDADIWDERRLAAYRAAAVLMGRATEQRRSLFEVVGECFVAGMRDAFPQDTLDAPRFLERHASWTAAELVEEFKVGRAEYRQAREKLAEIEAQTAVAYAPSVELRPGSALEHFEAWLGDTNRLDLGAVLDLHEQLPRFAGGRVMPIIERDAGGAYLETAFPWSSVSAPASVEVEVNESDITDSQDAFELEGVDGADESDNDDVNDGRYLVTDYWWAADVAGDVILGRHRA